MAGAQHRIVHAHFEKFATARLAFVRSIAECTERAEYLEALLAEDAFHELRPMLRDKVTTVQATAATALGRIAGFSPELATELLRAVLLDDIIASMPGAHPAYLKAAAGAMRAVGKHSPALAQACIDIGCINALVRGVVVAVAGAAGRV